MEAVVHLDEVKDIETRGGNVRYVVRDREGNEYTTFGEQIGKRARELEGQTLGSRSTSSSAGSTPTFISTRSSPLRRTTPPPAIATPTRRDGARRSRPPRGWSASQSPTKRSRPRSSTTSSSRSRSGSRKTSATTTRPDPTDPAEAPA